jgi:acyl-ACP thioesterase
MEKHSIWTEKTTVTTYQTDFQHNWKPAEFFRAMQEATTHHAQHLNVDHFSLIEQNITWVLSRMKIRFYRFPKTMDQITIRTWPKGIQQKIFFMRDYQMMDEQGNKFADASSAWLLIDTNKRRFVFPDALKDNLPDNDGKSALDEPLEKIARCDTLKVRETFKARYSSVDFLGHVNNTHYIDWIFDCFTLDEIRRKQLSWLQINYNAEVKPDEEVAVAIGKTNSQPDIYTINGTNLNTTGLAFEAQFGLVNTIK